MRILVIGAGAVGGYFGGRLAAAGNDVSFVARGKHLEALQNRGLRIESPKGSVHLKTVRVTDDPRSLEPAELILPGVKAWQLDALLPQLKPLLREESSVLPLQNGVESAEKIAAVLGPEHTLGGLCRIIAYVEEPGLIRHASYEPTITFGELDNRHSERVGKIHKLFESAGINSVIAGDIRLATWQKFLFICAVSGLGAATRSVIGEMRGYPPTREMLLGLLREIVAVGRAHDVHFPADSVERMLVFIDSLARDATSSMQRDIMAGRPSELEAQTGAVVRLAEKAKVEVPLNRFVYNCLSLMERRARS